MKKYVPILAAAVVLIVVLIVAVSSGGGKTPATEAPLEEIPTASEGNTQTLNVYYQSAKGYLVPVARKIAVQDNMAQAALDLLHDTSANWSDAATFGVMPTLPEGATASVNVSGGIAQVNLEGMVCQDADSENTALASMTATLLDMPQINVVRYTVNGEASAMLPFGTSVAQAMTQVKVNAEDSALAVASSDNTTQIQLAFVEQESGLLVPVTRTLSGSCSLSAALAELTVVPEGNSDLVSAIPQSCEFLGASVTDDTVIVDMSASFAELSPQEATTAARAIVYTAMQDSDVLDVVIRAGGVAVDNEATAQTLPVALNVASERISVLQSIGTGKGDAIENDAVEPASLTPQPTTPLTTPTPSPSPTPTPSMNRK